MTYLNLENINKIYPGSVQAVFDFNLQANEGEFIVLVGPSGCGKSTVLRMICGLEEITSGSMFLNDEFINDLAPSDREMAMVFQDYALYGNMTVYQNIGFSMTINRTPEFYIHKRVMETARAVKLNDYLNRFPRALSGGQRQRVAMGRSLAKRARVLLMDEPLSNLDAQLRQETRRELAMLHNMFKPTVVYVTHDQTEAMTLASKIVVMNEGRVQQIGTPYDIYNTPANIFTASFVGMPPINLIRGYVEEAAFTGLNSDMKPIMTCTLPFTLNVRNVVMGLRPEDVRILPPGKEKAENEVLLDVMVGYMELLGAEYNAGLVVNGCMITGRIPAHFEIRHGQRLKVVFNINKAHFFDEKTGLRLLAHSLRQG